MNVANDGKEIVHCSDILTFKSILKKMAGCVVFKMIVFDEAYGDALDGDRDVFVPFFHKKVNVIAH